MRLPVLPVIAVICCSVTLLIAGCQKAQVAHEQTFTYTIYTPVAEKRSDVYAAINGNRDEPIDMAGKIYVKGKYIYVNEIDKGIHVIDNTDPTNPYQAAFIRIPGNRDIAIKSNILYADMYSELLSLNIEDIRHVTIASDLANVFPDRGPGYNDDTTDMVMGFVTRDTTVTQILGPVWQDCANCYLSSVPNSPSVNKSASGKAGSMARMVLLDDNLYAIAEQHSLSVLDVSRPEVPKSISHVNAGFDLETIFPFENKLFLGSAIGVYMFDISDRANPRQLGMFTHGRACDPVIADGHYAYVTLHAGTSCGGDANELDVLDINDLTNPSLMRSYPLTQPKGLSKDGNLLFVCDGDDSVKLFDASAPEKLKYLSQMSCPDPYDVITGDHTAMVIAKKGIYQFDYTDPSHIRQLSVLSTTIK